VKAALPNGKPTEITKELGNRWRALSEAKKAEFKALAIKEFNAKQK
jgi:hypothetical protein